MRSTKSNSTAAILDRYGTALVNVENQPQINAAMAELGYDTAAIAVGKSLLEAANEAIVANYTESNEALQAYDAFAGVKNELDKEYTLLRKKAKVVFSKEPMVLKYLAVSGEKAATYSNWLGDIRKFCKGLLADQALLDKMARLKVGKASLEATLQKCALLDELRAAYLREKGESQNATVMKDEALMRLDDWMREFYDVSRIALDENPQLLEAIGLFVRS